MASTSAAASTEGLYRRRISSLSIIPSPFASKSRAAFIASRSSKPLTGSPLPTSAASSSSARSTRQHASRSISPSSPATSSHSRSTLKRSFALALAAASTERPKRCLNSIEPTRPCAFTSNALADFIASIIARPRRLSDRPTSAANSSSASRARQHARRSITPSSLAKSSQKLSSLARRFASSSATARTAGL